MIKLAIFLFCSRLFFFIFLKYVAESEEKICSQNKIATQTRLKSAHVHISIYYMTSFEFLDLQYFFLSKKINYTSWIYIFSEKMASKTRFNSTHQSLLTTWHVEFLLNLQYFFFQRKLISCSFKIELVLWIFESSFGRICKLISYYKRVVNEKKAVVSNYWTR